MATLTTTIISAAIMRTIETICIALPPIENSQIYKYNLAAKLVRINRKHKIIKDKNPMDAALAGLIEISSKDTGWDKYKYSHKVNKNLGW